MGERKKKERRCVWKIPRDLPSLKYLSKIRLDASRGKEEWHTGSTSIEKDMLGFFFDPLGK
jgi:hypothetical protein